MINQLTLRIPYYKRIGFISFNIKKKVDFSFDNLSMFIFREDEKIDTPDDFEQWQKEHSQYDLFIHAVYSAAKSYYLQHKKDFKFDIKKFALGLAQLPESDLKKLTEVWQRSQNYGIDKLNKKKATVKA